jgi:hypothetical protein
MIASATLVNVGKNKSLVRLFSCLKFVFIALLKQCLFFAHNRKQKMHCSLPKIIKQCIL